MNGAEITMIGNCTRTPELRYTTGGRGVASFGIAVNRRYQSNGEWQEQTSFFDVVAWGELGEHAAACIDKGTRVIVVGRLEQRSWEAQDGEKRSKIEVVAEAIGPDLRWVSVEINKADRSRGEDRQPASQPAAPAQYSEEPF